MATGFKSGGRQKGTPNKATSVKFAEIVASGETPLDYMLRVMRDPQNEHPRRDDMAKAVAPYIHPKLAATELTGADGGPIEVAETPSRELGKAILALLGAAAKTE